MEANPTGREQPLIIRAQAKFIIHHRCIRILSCIQGESAITLCPRGRRSQQTHQQNPPGKKTSEIYGGSKQQIMQNIFNNHKSLCSGGPVIALYFRDHISDNPRDTPPMFSSLSSLNFYYRSRKPRLGCPFHC